MTILDIEPFRDLSVDLFEKLPDEAGVKSERQSRAPVVVYEHIEIGPKARGSDRRWFLLRHSDRVTRAVVLFGSNGESLSPSIDCLLWSGNRHVVPSSWASFFALNERWPGAGNSVQANDGEGAGAKTRQQKS